MRAASSSPGTRGGASPACRCRSAPLSWLSSGSVRELGGWPSFGQREIERRAFAGFALGPHAAAMAKHHALHDGEPHAGTRELPRAMQALEHAEQLAVISHVEAGAVVLHVIDVPRILAAASQFDRSEEHTSELQSPCNLVCRLLLETK